MIFFSKVEIVFVVVDIFGEMLLWCDWIGKFWWIDIDGWWY